MATGIRTGSGLEFDPSCATLTIGITQIPFVMCEYSDNMKAEWIYEAGRQAASADTPGQYETKDGKLKVRSSVARAIIFPRLPQFGAANALTQAVCNFLHPDIGADSDLLVGFRMMGTQQSIEAGAKGLEMEIPIRYRLIKWTNARVCWAADTGGAASGALRL